MFKFNKYQVLKNCENSLLQVSNQILKLNENNSNIIIALDTLSLDINTIITIIDEQNKFIDNIIKNHNEQLDILKFCVDQKIETQIKLQLDYDIKKIKYSLLSICLLIILILKLYNL
jgi:hypothetical protein